MTEESLYGKKTHVVTDPNKASLFSSCKYFYVAINHFVKIFFYKNKK